MTGKWHVACMYGMPYVHGINFAAAVVSVY